MLLSVASKGESLASWGFVSQPWPWGRLRWECRKWWRGWPQAEVNAAWGPRDPGVGGGGTGGWWGPPGGQLARAGVALHRRRPRELVPRSDRPPLPPQSAPPRAGCTRGCAWPSLPRTSLALARGLLEGKEELGPLPLSPYAKLGVPRRQDPIQTPPHRVVAGVGEYGRLSGA